MHEEDGCAVTNMVIKKVREEHSMKKLDKVILYEAKKKFGYSCPTNEKQFMKKIIRTW